VIAPGGIRTQHTPNNARLPCQPANEKRGPLRGPAETLEPVAETCWLSLLVSLPHQTLTTTTPSSQTLSFGASSFVLSFHFRFPLSLFNHLSLSQLAAILLSSVFTDPSYFDLEYSLIPVSRG
jgi:hypothetical protein